jgi:hypothetical protein
LHFAALRGIFIGSGAGINAGIAASSGRIGHQK